eukprot:3940727-Rhodomonas_salina.1
MKIASHLSARRCSGLLYFAFSARNRCRTSAGFKEGCSALLFHAALLSSAAGGLFAPPWYDRTCRVRSSEGATWVLTLHGVGRLAMHESRGQSPCTKLLSAAGATKPARCSRADVRTTKAGRIASILKPCNLQNISLWCGE